MRVYIIYNIHTQVCLGFRVDIYVPGTYMFGTMNTTRVCGFRWSSFPKLSIYIYANTLVCILYIYIYNERNISAHRFLLRSNLGIFIRRRTPGPATTEVRSTNCFYLFAIKYKHITQTIFP